MEFSLKFSQIDEIIVLYTLKKGEHRSTVEREESKINRIMFYFVSSFYLKILTSKRCYVQVILSHL